MKNGIMIFENHEVEIFEFNGKVLFNPRHVAECLDIEFKTAQNYMSLMSESKAVKLTNDSISHLTGFRKLNNTGENFLTESGVYKLIFKSRKPEAEKFQDWVVEEVLPSIRKTGGYKMVSSTEAATEMPKIASILAANKQIAAILGLDENHQIIKANKITMQQTGFDCMKEFDVLALEYKPNIQYHTPSILGDMCGLSAIKINKILEEKGLQEESRDNKNRLIWVVTEKGKQYSRVFDT